MLQQMEIGDETIFKEKKKLINLLIKVLLPVDQF